MENEHAEQTAADECGLDLHKELRARAEKALGPKFDIRKFHNALIDDGPLPLDVLGQRIEEWIKAHH